MEYQKVLLKRLLKMIEDNEKEKIYFESAKKKMPSRFLLLSPNIKRLLVIYLKMNNEHIGTMV